MRTVFDQRFDPVFRDVDAFREKNPYLATCIVCSQAFYDEVRHEVDRACPPAFRDPALTGLHLASAPLFVDLSREWSGPVASQYAVTALEARA